MTEDEIKREEKILPAGCILMSPRVRLSPRRDNFVYVFLLASSVLYLASYWCHVLSMHTRSFLETAGKCSVHAKAKNAETPAIRER